MLRSIHAGMFDKFLSAMSLVNSDSCLGSDWSVVQLLLLPDSSRHLTSFYLTDPSNELCMID